ncbi:Nucleic acid-binding, OB-fold [Cynara cardunculus var. scolymus]|uniref:Nucleic acid-binding, OB-fold n=1 Tax=Cynara cardunculus var. scolymus TaxID=59895 RepID=A0A118JV50_CYNCS|nr:Nucleic acid-binding, OB-fold [Cynara cardunculus var. scolymus]
MSTTSPPNSDCRMYEAKYPEVDTPVMIQVKEIGDVATHVSLLEYNNIEGMILLSDLSRRRIRSVGSLIKVGRIEPAMVLRVNAEKGYIDLSKKRLSEQDVQVCEERYSKSKLVHSIMRHVSETKNVDLEDLYIHVGWPLYRKYGHAFEAFKSIVNDPDSVLKSLTRVVREIGSDGKEEAMRRAEAVGTKDCLVKIKLVAPPSYVLNTQTLDKVTPHNNIKKILTKEQGIRVLTEAISACAAAIERHKGKLTIKESPRAVSEREDKLLAEQMAKLGRQNAEVSGDEDSEVEEDTGMGSSVDLDSTSSGITE